jgi:hypothetical protein
MIPKHIYRHHFKQLSPLKPTPINVEELLTNPSDEIAHVLNNAFSEIRRLGEVVGRVCAAMQKIDE